MKQRLYITKIFLLVLFLGLFGCSQATPVGVNYSVRGIPSISKFQSEKLEKYARGYPSIQEVVLCKDGREIQIEVDDPRVTQLMNFISYSEYSHLSAISSSVCPLDDLPFGQDRDSLTITFCKNEDSHSETTELQYIHEIVISGCVEYRFFQDGYRIAFPYYEQFYHAWENGRVSNVEYYTAHAIVYEEFEPWLDILTYCGF